MHARRMPAGDVVSILCRKAAHTGICTQGVSCPEKSTRGIPAHRGDAPLATPEAPDNAAGVDGSHRSSCGATVAVAAAHTQVKIQFVEATTAATAAERGAAGLSCGRT
jgi:hypothetical protein